MSSTTMGAAAAAPNRAMVTVATMVATIMQALDTTIANVALPHMQGSLSATQDQISWVLTSYIVAAAIFTPPTGFFADRFGRKTLFLVAISGFTVASMLCGIATTIDQMVLFRLLQGVFGASLVPLSQAVLLDTYPPQQHGSAMAIWGVGVMVGPILGPTLGGWLTDYYNWRWVFYINLPFGILAFLGVLFFVQETERRKRPFDAFGFAMLSLSIGALQMMLDRGETKDWFSSTEIVIEAVLSAVCFYVFVVHMFTAKNRFLEPAIFKDRNVLTGVSFIFIFGIVMLATMSLMPTFLQNLLDYPVVTTGLVLAPRGVGTMLAMMLVGRLITRVDPRYLVLFGLLCTSLSLELMARWSLDITPWTVVHNGLLQGVGMGFLFVPLSTLTFATLDPRYRTEAAGLYSLMRNIGSSIGVSIVITLLAQNTQRYHQILGEKVNPYNPLAKPDVLPSLWNWTDPHGAAALNAALTAQANLLGYLYDFRLMAIIVLFAVPLVFVLRRPVRRGGQDDGHMAVLE